MPRTAGGYRWGRCLGARLDRGAAPFKDDEHRVQPLELGARREDPRPRGWRVDCSVTGGLDRIHKANQAEQQKVDAEKAREKERLAALTDPGDPLADPSGADLELLGKGALPQTLNPRP